MEDEQNGRCPKWKMTKMEDENYTFPPLILFRISEGTFSIKKKWDFKIFIYISKRENCFFFSAICTVFRIGLRGPKKKSE